MTEPNAEQHPSWRFWGSLPIWKVLLVFLVCNLTVTLIFVGLREGLGMNVPQWLAGGIGGGLSILVIFRMRGLRLPSPPVV